MTSLPMQETPPDPNLAFLRIMDKHPQEQGLKHELIQRKINSIKRVLSDLDASEVHEWKRLQLLKIGQIAHKLVEEAEEQREKGKMGAGWVVVKEHMRILVYICCDLKVSYEKQRVEEVIKAVYFAEYREDILRRFEEVGYDTSNYQTLNYDDSWSMCCCFFGG